MSTAVEHVRLIDGGELMCMHCGEKEPWSMMGRGITSKAIQAAMLLTEDFQDRHRKCVEMPTSPTRRLFAYPEDWLRESGDTGVSSKTIYSVMMKVGFRKYDVPHDPGDFGRCHRLLVHFPAWRARMPEVAVQHPTWAPLVDAWDELSALYVEELPTGVGTKLWARLKALRGER